MSAPGLDRRLNQHARRAGLMVGISMALTIAVCIGSFVWIFARVDPLTRDFVNQATSPPTRRAAANAGDSATEEPTQEPSDSGNVQEANPTEEPAPTAVASAFEPTHQMIAETPVNLRPGPGVNSGAPISTVNPGAQLQYLNDTELGQDPDGGDLNWLRFRTEEGLEGWIREVDVQPLNAGQ